MGDTRYQAYLTAKEEGFEAACARCGECCGLEEDPCNNLTKDPDGTCFCVEYSSRLGPQRTISNIMFNCVSIRDRIRQGSLPQKCAYRRSHLRGLTEKLYNEDR